MSKVIKSNEDADVLVSHVSYLVDFCDRSSAPRKEALENLAASILSTIDGNADNICSYELTPVLAPTSEEEAASNKAAFNSPNRRCPDIAGNLASKFREVRKEMTNDINDTHDRYSSLSTKVKLLDEFKEFLFQPTTTIRHF